MLGSTLRATVLKKFNNAGEKKKNNRRKHIPLLPKFSKLPCKVVFYLILLPFPGTSTAAALAGAGCPPALLSLAPSAPGKEGDPPPSAHTVGKGKAWQRTGMHLSVHPQLRSAGSNSFNRFTSLRGVSDRILLARSMAADAL